MRNLKGRGALASHIFFIQCSVHNRITERARKNTSDIITDHVLRIIWMVIMMWLDCERQGRRQGSRFDILVGTTPSMWFL